MKWDPHSELVKFGNFSYHLGHAFEGAHIMGATGSGKTSGSGRLLAAALLKAGFGGLVLTAKSGEAERWSALVNDAGRSNNLIVVDASTVCGMDVLLHEASQPGSLSDSLVAFLWNAVQAKRGSGGGDPFWDNSAKELMAYAIDMLRLAGGSDSSSLITVANLIQLIRGAPRDREDWESLSNDVGVRAGVAKFAEFWQAAKECNDRTSEQRVSETFWSCADYFGRDLLNMAAATRSSIESMVYSRLGPLLRHPIRGVFASEGRVDVKWSPAACESGQIVVLDFPIKVFGEGGLVAQRLYKTMWQRHLERRPAADRAPVFLFIDEAQYFVSEEDVEFQQTSRESRCATVMITQNLPNYWARLGRESHLAESVIGNLQCKIFHQNGDPDTNEWASRVFGDKWVASGQVGAGSSPYRAPVVMPNEFANLKIRHGKSGEAVSEAFVYCGGRFLGGTRSPNLNMPWRVGDAEGAVAKVDFALG